MKLAREFWPGPMTLILKRSNLAKNFITGGQDCVGIRVPANHMALKLLHHFEQLGGEGVAAPSANRFGAVSPTTAESVSHALKSYLAEDDLILDGDGQVASGSASLPDPAVLETEEQRLERERNEHDVLEALSEKKSVAGLFAVNCKSSRNVLLDSKTKRGRLRC